MLPLKKLLKCTSLLLRSLLWISPITKKLVYAPALAANTEFLDESQISLAIAVSDVLEKTAALAHKAQQTTARSQVMLVTLQMVG